MRQWGVSFGLALRLAYLRLGSMTPYLAPHDLYQAGSPAAHATVHPKLATYHICCCRTNVTQDVDFCYNPDPANLTRLVAALAPLHPRLRVAGMTDEDTAALPFHLDARALQQSPILTLRTDAGDLDLMSAVAGVGAFDKVCAASVDVDLFGYRIPVLDLPGLIAPKRAAGRAKDLLALPQIEATPRLRDLQRAKDEGE